MTGVVLLCVLVDVHLFGMTGPVPPVVQVVDCLRSEIRTHGIDVDVTAVVRDRNGQRVVRLRPKMGNGIHRIVDVLLRLAPLAQVASLTSEVDGRDEVEVRLPTRCNLRTRAVCNSSSQLLPWVMGKAAQVLFVVAAGICVAVFVERAP